MMPVGLGHEALDTVLIVNPNSCSGLTGKNWKELYAKIKKIFGRDIKVVFSKKQGDGTSLARDYLRKGFSRVVAIGGDGTINEVANGFFEEHSGIRGYKLRRINPDAIMGIVPCGTRNVLAKSVGLPAGVIESCQNFVGGMPTKIDLIAVSATNPDTDLRTPSRVFLNAAEIGLGAEIIDRSKRVRTKLKNRLVSTAAAIISTVPSYESNLCDVFIDGRKKSTNMTMGVIANGKFLGGSFMAAPEASVVDGLLDLVIMKDSGSFKMLDELLSIKDGNYEKENNILYAKAKKVVIKSNEREVTVTIDGEPVGILPATFHVLPKALTIVI
ncbi:MAG: diacylglycerol kinase family protein [Thermoproteota archaeon]